MNAPPAVSVVMAVYNGATNLRQTLDSILDQRGVDFEVVVIDDGSTDSSGVLLDQLAIDDARVRVIHQENRGLTRALITGCAAAHGPYIARCDAGDTSYPQRLATQKTLLDSNAELVFVSCWTEYVGPELEPLYEVKGTGMAARPIAILDPSQKWGVIDGPTHHGSVMMRREAYERAGGYRHEFAAGQDWDLWYRLAALGEFQIAQETLYTARITPGSISGSARTAQQELATLSLAAMKARLRGESDASTLRQAAAVKLAQDTTPQGEARGLYAIGEALRRRGDARARGYLRRAVSLCPSLLRAWIRYAQSFF